MSVLQAPTTIPDTPSPTISSTAQPARGSTNRRSSIHFNRATRRWQPRSSLDSNSPRPSLADLDMGSMDELDARSVIGGEAGSMRGVMSHVRGVRPAKKAAAKAKVVKQLVVEASLDEPKGGESRPADGLRVKMFLRVSVTSSILPSTEAHLAVTFPLMSDQNLRVHSSSVFPYPSHTPSSEEASEALTALGLSTSHSDTPSPAFGRARGNTLKRRASSFSADTASSVLSASSLASFTANAASAPSVEASISIRNFAVCLVLRRANSSPAVPESPAHAMSPTSMIGSIASMDDTDDDAVEYIVVLHCLAKWATRGPDWPFSVCIPTPSCLRNTLRLSPPGSSQLQNGSSTFGAGEAPVAFTTKPRLRERDARDTPARFRASVTPNTVTSSSVPRRLKYTGSASPATPSPAATGKAAEDSKSGDDEEAEPDLAEESEPEVELDPALESASESDVSDNVEDHAQLGAETEEARPEAEGTRLVEGVFPSTDQLWILLSPAVAHAAAVGSAEVDRVLRASRVKTRLRAKVETATSEANSISLNIQLSVDFKGLNCASAVEAVPLCFSVRLGTRTTGEIINPLSMEWSFDDAHGRKGIADASFPRVIGAPSDRSWPQAPHSQEPTSSSTGHALLPDDSPSKRSVASLSSEPDLWRTKAPFPTTPGQSAPQTPGKAHSTEPDISFETSFRSSVATPGIATPSPGLIDRLASATPQSTTEFVVWVEPVHLVELASANAETVEVTLDFVGKVYVPVLVSEDGSRTCPLPILDYTGVLGPRAEGEGKERSVTFLSIAGTDLPAACIEVPEAFRHTRLSLEEGDLDRIKLRPPANVEASLRPCITARLNSPVAGPVEPSPPSESRKTSPVRQRPALPASLLSGGELDRLDLGTPSLGLLDACDVSGLADPIASVSIDLTFRKPKRDRSAQYICIHMRVTARAATEGREVLWELAPHQQLRPLSLFVGAKQVEVDRQALDDVEPTVAITGTVREPRRLWCFRVPPTTLDSSSFPQLIEVRMAAEVINFGATAVDVLECALPRFPALVQTLDIGVCAEGGRSVTITSAAGAQALEPSKARGFSLNPSYRLGVAVALSHTRRRDRLPHGFEVWSYLTLVLLAVSVLFGYIHHQAIVGQVQDLSFEVGRLRQELAEQASRTRAHSKPLVAQLLRPLQEATFVPTLSAPTTAEQSVVAATPIGEPHRGGTPSSPHDAVEPAHFAPLRFVQDEISALISNLKNVIVSLLQFFR